MRPSTRSSRAIRPTATTNDTPATIDTTKTNDPKSKKPRHRMTNRQLEHLEALYQKATHPSRQEKETLANKVEMDMRTVTVWFQNRRQLAKKADENSTREVPAHSSYLSLKDYRRSPLSAVDQPDQNRGREISPGQNQDRELGLQKVMSTLQAAARKQLQDASPEPPRRHPNMPIQIRIGSPEEEEAPRSRKRSGMLEWACSRSAKRTRIYRDEEEDQDNSTEDEDAASDYSRTIVADSPPKVKYQPPKSILIPAEYNSKFDPDMVLGASLLLTFKYSSAK
ncbi:hypothetical protein BXZ70DRAFT_295006 [Cristinia sonorae]|uniref:Homeobox domain-containing protein n=1 Tax=Cristinia sonorae TaxID=1940300 RepID=A0A8K0ULF9_9AGAR|nr:hypothetical protein BXZ70DRAFT_295006 [Cristinia sonorae]